MAMVNDGFPNVFPFLIYNVDGLPHRCVFLSTENVKAGEQLCWNYLTDRVKYFSPYVELRPRATRDFMRNKDSAYLQQYLKSVNHPHAFALEEAIEINRFTYILSTPAVLFNLFYDGTLSQSFVQELLSVSLRSHIPPVHRHHFENLVQQTVPYIQLKEALTKQFPQTGRLFDNFISCLVESVGIVNAISVSDSMRERLWKVCRGELTLANISRDDYDRILCEVLQKKMGSIKEQIDRMPSCESIDGLQEFELS